MPTIVGHFDAPTGAIAEGCCADLRTTFRHGLAVAMAAAIVFFTNLGGPALWDEDEPKNAACAAEMLAGGDWLVPTFNGELRVDKPILVYWLMQSAYRLFGVNEFAARFWSALLSVGTCLLTWQLGRRLYGPTAGLWAGLILATCLLFGVSARAATTDAALVFCTTLALVTFGASACQRSSDGPNLTKYSAARSLELPRAGMVYGAMGLAMLAKGPVGLVLPVAVMGLFVWRRDVRAQSEAEPGNTTAARSKLAASALRAVQQLISRIAHPRTLIVEWWHAAAAIRLLSGTIVALVVAVPWYLLVGIATDGEWPASFLFQHNLGRFSGTMEGHGGPPFYYAVAILVGATPWSLPVVLGLLAAVRRRRNSRTATPDLFLLCWAAVYVWFFSLSKTKLPSYVLPCFPALAILAGRFVQGWLNEPPPYAAKIQRCMLGGAACLGLAILIGCPRIPPEKLPDGRILGLVGIAPLVGGLAALGLMQRQHLRAALGVYAMTAVVFLAASFGFAAARVAALQTSKPAVAALRSADKSVGPIGVFGDFRPGLVFYSGARVENLWHPIFVGRFLRRFPDACLVMRAELLPLVEAELPPDMTVVDRRRAFMKSREIVVLRRQAASAVAEQVVSPEAGPTLAR